MRFLNLKNCTQVSSSRAAAVLPRLKGRRSLQACGLCALALSAAPLTAFGQTSQPVRSQSATAAANPPLPYKKMDLDELMGIEFMDVGVTSVSKRESTVGQSPSAVHVITQDDIRRSGATSIPQALRMAPGLEVAQIDNSTWAISARGFNSSTANKLLVLMDGRSVYTPLYSGVFWDAQDTMMQDIDRIEVIRGPAGALWGANAVNGVINVITKDARDTQGLLVTGGGGNEARNFGSARYGWKVGNDAFARVYGKHFERDESVLGSGAAGGDDWIMDQGGFRIDWRPSAENHYTFQGDIYDGTRNNLMLDDIELSGGNILGRWTHQLASGGDMTVQMYYDRTERDMPGAFGEERDTFDVDFSYHFALTAAHDITFGLGYRVSSDEVANSAAIIFIPDTETEQTFSAFIQDEIQLVPDRLRLTLGAKFEHNEYTGFEIQPSARLIWMVDHKQALWGAISRAVRTSTRLERDLSVETPTASLLGNKDFDSEEVIAYEAGYRIQPNEFLALDVSAYYNKYDSLRSLERSGTEFMIDNKLHGETYGFEVGTTLKPADWWMVRAAYTHLRVELEADSDSTDVLTVRSEGNDPRHQVYLRSSMDLPRNVDLDLTMRYVSELSNPDVPEYVAVDARLAWRPNDHMELAVVGQNLFDNQHPEFGGANRHEVQRSVFGTVTFKW